MSSALDYRAFLEEKVSFAGSRPLGFDIPLGAVAEVAKPHQRAIVQWAVKGGRRAIFARFGLGKTLMQIETMRLVLLSSWSQGPGLIVAPLGVRQEFIADARDKCGFDLPFIRTTAEMKGDHLYLTNYESVREGKIDVSRLAAVSLDEASVLRGFGGTKTFREFMRLFDSTRFRFVATATPSPNQYIEILAYAAFLGVMDVGEAKTRWFKRNSEKADQLTIHPHKEEEFWLWVNTWAVFLQNPSELGFSDEGYDLPPLKVQWHSVDSDITQAGVEKSGQVRLVRSGALGVQDEARVRRISLDDRIAKVRALVESRPDDHVIIWHDLEDERHAIERQIEGVTAVYGSQDLDEREDAVAAFANGRIARLAAKPVMLGSGCNLQRHCRWAIFAGVGFKFNDFIQAIHRIYRFLQTGEVTIDIVFAADQAEVVQTLKDKWERHNRMMARMSEIIRQFGLNALDTQTRLTRTIGVTRRERRGANWCAVLNDTVDESGDIDVASVGFILTSIPFGTQYEYTPSYNDFGHTDDDVHFFRQMDYLSPSLLRMLKPGRMMAVHVKDRIRPGGMDGIGFQSVSPFHARTIEHYIRHGFVYMGMITVVTDVVRENASTYRLGWSEQCKDGSRMSVGLPEYVLLFRKRPTDATNGYADEPVVKSKADYTRSRWQIDAAGQWRSAGDRVLTPDDLIGLPADQMYRIWRGYNATHVYDHEQHVAIGEALDTAKRLPPGFALIPAHSWHPDVWSDVARMRTLNGSQAAKGKEMHLCPLQFDIVDRLINRYTNRGDLVFDPFMGLGTVPLRALRLGRRGLGVELNAAYFADAVRYLQQQEERAATPSLFSLDELTVDGDENAEDRIAADARDDDLDIDDMDADELVESSADLEDKLYGLLEIGDRASE